MPEHKYYATYSSSLTRQFPGHKQERREFTASLETRGKHTVTVVSTLKVRTRLLKINNF